MRPLLIILGWLVAFSAAAQTSASALIVTDDGSSDQYLGRVQAHTKGEIEELMNRAEAVLEKVLAGESIEPIQFVLHGDEVRLFFRRNYQQNKELINRAARLDAFNVIDIKVCRTWMGFQQEPLDQLYPFVETVSFGPSEEKRLLSEGYIYF